MPPCFSNPPAKGRCRSFLLRLLPFVLLSGFLMQAAISAIQESATWDETHSFGLGEYLLKNWKWDVPGSILHPPLPFYISSIPFLLVEDDHQSLWQYDSDNLEATQFLAGVDLFRGQTLLSSDVNKDNVLFFFTRLMIVFVSLLLGFYVYRWSRDVYGDKGGLLSLYLFCLSPNMLAHGHLTTPDMVLTAFSFIACYHYWRALVCSSRRDSIVGGIFFGFALLSKFTGILLFPIFFILLCCFRIQRKEWNAGNVFLFHGIGVFVFFLGYGLDITPYIQGIMFQLQHSGQGHSSFLMGEHSTRGWWYYFIVAFLIKTPVPTLVFFCLSLFLTARSFPSDERMHGLFLITPVVFIFTFFSIMHQSIGLRYILPIYPFIFVTIGMLAKMKSSGRIRTAAFAFLLFWYFWGAARIHPHYLAYFNEFIRGPENGYHYLVDSNLDWGQGLIGLKKYMEERKIGSVYLSYFGTDLPERYGIKCHWLPSPVITAPSFQDTYAKPRDGFVAISATNLQGVYFRNKDIYSWLKEYEPVDKIGYSIFIYHLKKDGT